jgi:hypothetical protein
MKTVTRKEDIQPFKSKLGLFFKEKGDSHIYQKFEQTVC